MSPLKDRVRRLAIPGQGRDAHGDIPGPRKGPGPTVNPFNPTSQGEKRAEGLLGYTDQHSGGGLINLATRDALRDWIDAHSPFWAESLPGCVRPGAFAGAALTALYNDTRLQRCDPQSVLMALVQSAYFGLLPDGKHAVLVPHDRHADFVPMYQGYLELMYRSGLVKSTVFDHIRHGDKWHVDQGKPAPDDFTHEKNVVNPGSPMVAYFFAWLPGNVRSQIHFCDRARAEAIRDQWSEDYKRAEAAGTYDSLWHTRFNDMWLKTVVRQGARSMPTSPEVRQLMDYEEQSGRGHRIPPSVLNLPDEAWAATNADDLAADAQQAAHQAAKAAAREAEEPT
ncbi:recombinase RecT [Actinomadura litoris]|uniref:recombinase RecT n=1 Tax=Actinomadura litoris TaxID=2678616 RepID=UPI001FA6E66F|nr:RecT family recombinase [Actinomadura litoris]